MIARAQTRSLKIGSLPLGGGAPVSVQTMATADPHDAEALVTQVLRCAEAGADLVRLTVPDLDAARALALGRNPGTSGGGVMVRPSRGRRRRRAFRSAWV